MICKVCLSHSVTNTGRFLNILIVVTVVFLMSVKYKEYTKNTLQTHCFFKQISVRPVGFLAKNWNDPFNCLGPCIVASFISHHEDRTNNISSHQSYISNIFFSSLYAFRPWMSLMMTLTAWLLLDLAGEGPAPLLHL